MELSCVNCFIYIYISKVSDFFFLRVWSDSEVLPLLHPHLQPTRAMVTVSQSTLTQLTASTLTVTPSIQRTQIPSLHMQIPSLRTLIPNTWPHIVLRLASLAICTQHSMLSQETLVCWFCFGSYFFNGKCSVTLHESSFNIFVGSKQRLSQEELCSFQGQ